MFGSLTVAEKFEKMSKIMFKSSHISGDCHVVEANNNGEKEAAESHHQCSSNHGTFWRLCIIGTTGSQLIQETTFRAFQWLLLPGWIFITPPVGTFRSLVFGGFKTSAPIAFESDHVVIQQSADFRGRISNSVVGNFEICRTGTLDHWIWKIIIRDLLKSKTKWLHRHWRVFLDQTPYSVHIFSICLRGVDSVPGSR